MALTGLVTVDEMDEAEWRRLRAASGCVGPGGAQRLIDRLRKGLRGRQLTVRESDLPKIVELWESGRTRPGGKPSGGFQAVMPIRSLSAYLPTLAPLFMDPSLPPPKPPMRWVYFRVQANDLTGRIKIGGAKTTKRRDQERSTDNPARLITVLKVLEQPGATEQDYHRRFEKWRIRPNQEWFWYDEVIQAFVRETSEAQLARLSGPTVN